MQIIPLVVRQSWHRNIERLGIEEMMNLSQKKWLSIAMSALMTFTTCYSVSGYASDIDIYSVGTGGGKTRIMFLLDTSISMKASNNFKDACDASVAESLLTVPTTTDTSDNTFNGQTIPTYARSYCQTGGTTQRVYYYKRTKSGSTTSWTNCGPSSTNSADCTVTSLAPTSTSLTSYTAVTTATGNNSCSSSSSTCFYYKSQIVGVTKYYDRITKLKDGLFDVLLGRNGSAKLGDNILAGLTDFSGSKVNNNGTTGLVLLPARRLDAPATECGVSSTQRQCMLLKIAELSANNLTPTGNAYAVAAQSLLTTIGSDTSSCNGNGIYALTDGGPTQGSNYNPQSKMQNSFSSVFSCKRTDFYQATTSLTGTTLVNPESDAPWQCIEEFARTLATDTTTRPVIKTAAVGFGKFYQQLLDNGYAYDRNLDNAANKQKIVDAYDAGVITNDYVGTGGATKADIANTALWGVYGKGGWYSASNPAQIAQSIVNFVDEVKPTFDSVTTGSPTLPQDALNPLRIQPYAYYASFIPKPQDNTQMWAGNMNKYHVVSGEIRGTDKTTKLFDTDGALNKNVTGIWNDSDGDGVAGRLPLGILNNNVRRTIYTNREIIGSETPYTAKEIDKLEKINLQNLFAVDSNVPALFKNDPQKNYWLNLLGYNVPTAGDAQLADFISKTVDLRQMGAVMHSTPILLTQEGKITVTNGKLDTTNRKDYLLFGTTQGILHIVKVKDGDTNLKEGEEVFAFVPNEMMQNEKQRTAFLQEKTSSPELLYGIDGPWTAHTQYIAKADGTLTVNNSGRTITDSTSGDEIALKGLQWVYGGLRMGGRSYYGLDLSDITNPKLKFHINPDGADNTGGALNTENALSYMGQSWSKPTLAYVNFGGEKKLVMFVGGGYDTGYETPAYNQTNNKGAGVYMFDANNGNLLWWSSVNASTNKGAQAHTENSDLKYSVVSQINAVDRDSDGLVDHLYFGDLGGQAFRIDLNNNATGDDATDKKGNFVTRIVRLLNQHVDDNGTSPRFYEMPSFSVSKDDNGSLVGVVALSSGNRSSPLSGAIGTNNATASTSANDGVFVVFDKDVVKTDLYSLVDTDLTTKNIATLRNLNTYFTASFAGDIYKNGVSVVANDGWKYTYSNSAGVYKGMNGLYALDGMLYVNVFHRDGNGIGGSCGAGVKGDSKLYQFCLPTGKCNFYSATTTQPNSTNLGAGILGTGIGDYTDGNSTSSGLMKNVTSGSDCSDTANKNLPQCQLFSTTAKLQHLRWYEAR